jgi:hypothetical protein
LKYTFIDTVYPLYGVTPMNSYSLDAALNTSLPTHEDRIELSGSWTPTDNFMLSASVWLERTYNHGPYAYFNEDNYPFLVTAWYAPTCKWNVTGGFAQLTNWINQDITMGGNEAPGRDGRPELSLPMTSLWRYQGIADLVNLGTSYAMTERLTLTGGAEYVWGENVFINDPQYYTVQTYTKQAPSTATKTTNVDMSNLPGFSRVDVRTWRVSAGLDYLLRRNMSTFFRYNYFDYGDLAAAYNTGASHQVLGGLTGTY